MAAKYKIYYAMICDDVRTEKNNKDIIIGCYNDIIYVNSFPTSLAFAVRVSAYIDSKDFLTDTVTITNSSGDVVSAVTNPISYINLDRQTIFNRGYFRFIATEPADYMVNFGLDENIEAVLSFKVTTAALHESQ